MKRIKAACICQTLHFQLKEDLEHSIAVRLVREEVEHYKQALERNRTRHKIVDAALSAGMADVASGAPKPAANREVAGSTALQKAIR